MKQIGLIRMGVALAMIVAGTAAHGELNVTLNISGDIDEILAVLQLLSQRGFGAVEFDEDDPLKVRVHSTHDAEEEGSTFTAGPSAGETSAAGPEAPAEPEAPPEPLVALNNPQVTPEACRPGANLLLSVEVIDKENVIDTVAATFGTSGYTVDVYDNGLNGDTAAGDGLWSRHLTAPVDAKDGVHEINIVAYDVNGSPIMTLTKDQILTNVTTRTDVTVARWSEQPAAAPAAP